MTLIAQRARPGLWADASNGLGITDAVLEDFRAKNGMGIFLYLSLGAPGRDDATAALLQRVCVTHGLQVSFVQHVRGVNHVTTSPGGVAIPPLMWRPGDHDGAVDAGFAVA